LKGFLLRLTSVLGVTAGCVLTFFIIYNITKIPHIEIVAILAGCAGLLFVLLLFCGIILIFTGKWIFPSILM